MNGKWSLPIPPARFFSKVNESFDPFDSDNYRLFLRWIEVVNLNHLSMGTRMGPLGMIRDSYNEWRGNLVPWSNGPTLSGDPWSNGPTLSGDDGWSRMT